jgi:hypothetical protein
VPTLSEFAKKKKIGYFLKQIPQNSCFPEIGRGSGWVRDYMQNNAWINF